MELVDQWMKVAKRLFIIDDREGASKHREMFSNLKLWANKKYPRGIKTEDWQTYSR